MLSLLLPAVAANAATISLFDLSLERGHHNIAIEMSGWRTFEDPLIFAFDRDDRWLFDRTFPKGEPWRPFMDSGAPWFLTKPWDHYEPMDHTVPSVPTVPEPSSLLLLGSGLVGLACFRHKRVRSSSGL
jgi:hypothetical protein